jgi:hypothetical protein
MLGSPDTKEREYINDDSNVGFVGGDGPAIHLGRCIISIPVKTAG